MEIPVPWLPLLGLTMSTGGLCAFISRVSSAWSFGNVHEAGKKSKAWAEKRRLRLSTLAADALRQMSVMSTKWFSFCKGPKALARAWLTDVSTQ